jgi:ribosomal protein L11 methyltransferase
MSVPGLWRVVVPAPSPVAAAAFEQALELLAVSLSVFEADSAPMPRAGEEPARWETDLWLSGACVVEAITDGPPDRSTIDTLLAIAAAGMDLPVPVPVIEPVAERDWIDETHRRFPPLEVGRFRVQGSHAGAPPPGKLPLIIDAAMAFGTGEHATTRGCLVLLDREMRRMRPRRVLDMGCGTAILAIAAAKVWRCPVVAVDIDGRAVRTARENAVRNGVGPFVATGVSDGYANPMVGRGWPYDLVLANILARPLVRLAPDLARHLAPGGVAILSGLLNWQEAGVISAHRAQGLALKARVRIGDWSALAVTRGQQKTGSPTRRWDDPAV